MQKIKHFYLTEREVMYDPEAMAKEYLSKPLMEVTEEDFDEMLNCLPPMRWHKDEYGIEKFLMSEFMCGPVTAQYASRNGKYYTKYVNAFDKLTWIRLETIDIFEQRRAQLGLHICDLMKLIAIENNFEPWEANEPYTVGAMVTYEARVWEKVRETVHPWIPGSFVSFGWKEVAINSHD